MSEGSRFTPEPSETIHCGTCACGAGTVQLFRTGKCAHCYIAELEASVAQSESTRTFTVPPKLHPATADLVARFATALAEKLHKAEERYDYDDGWSGSAWEEECRSRLYEHLSKGDPRDVANYCAFMWHHGWSTKNAPPGIAERHTKARNEGS